MENTHESANFELSESHKPLISSSDAFREAFVRNPSESERAPEWFTSAVKKIADAWFEPKSFEQNPDLYEKLGVRTFKKYMPTTGDLIHQLFWKKHGLIGDFVVPGSLTSLKNMATFTRVYETIHLAGVVLGTANITRALAENDIGAAGFWAGVNMLINVYPIMLQRYNRVRLYKAIANLEAHEKNASRQSLGDWPISTSEDSDLPTSMSELTS